MGLGYESVITWRDDEYRDSGVMIDAQDPYDVSIAAMSWRSSASWPVW